MDIEAQLAKATVKRKVRRQRSLSSSEAGSLDDSGNLSSHNASKESTYLQFHKRQLNESISDDEAERHKFTEFGVCRAANTDHITVDDQRLDLSGLSREEDLSSDKHLNLRGSVTRLKEDPTSFEDSSSVNLLTKNVSQGSSSKSEVSGRERNVPATERIISTQDEHLKEGSVCKLGDISEANNNASREVKDENPFSSEEIPVTVTLRRKPKLETAAVDVGPNKELSDVLQRRSHYLSNWESQASNGPSEADQKILQYEKQLEREKEILRNQCQLNAAFPVIVDEQLSKIMQERKVIIDSSSTDKLSFSKGSDIDDADTLKSDTKAADLLSLSCKRDSDISLHGVHDETQAKSCLSSDSSTGLDDMKEVEQDLIDFTESSATLELPSKDVDAVQLYDDSQINPLERTDAKHGYCRQPQTSKRSGLKSAIKSESLNRKSSWSPLSSNVFTSDESPRQRTQPVTSKEVEKALQSSLLSPGLNSFYDPLNYRPESGSEDRPRSRGILKVHEHENVPLKGILKHPSDHRDAPIKGILKTENLQPSTESESRSIHGILKHDSSSTRISERQHHGILKREKEKEPMSSSCSQNTLHGVLKSHPFEPDRTDLSDVASLSAPTISHVDKRDSAYDCTSETGELKMDMISGRAEVVVGEDVINDGTVEQKDCGEVLHGEEIHEDEVSIESPENDESDSFPETFDSAMDTKQQRPDIARSVSHSRHLTEPTTSDERLEAETVLGVPEIRAEDITPKSSVTERLAALQKSGEGWKRRFEPVRELSSGQRPKSFMASETGTTPKTSSDVVRRIRLTPGSGVRPESIADRLSLLTGSQETWKSKVAEKDTKMFTVEGKMNRHGVVVESAFSNSPKTPVDTRREHLPKVVAIEITPPALDLTEKEEEVVENIPVKVEIPRMDDELLDEFFKTSTPTNSKVDVTVDDFDHIFLASNDVLKSARKVMPRRTKAGSRNPLKTMSSYITLQTEYMEEKSGIAEKELNRLKRERVIGTPQLAQEALAGLASKENFSKVSLRKAGSFQGTGLGERHLPYKDIMLLRIKGRKWCQTRLVNPHWKCINSGDCFVLLTPDIVYLWIGRFSNVIEKNKSSDIANQIWQRHDLGVRPACQLAILDEEKPCPSRVTNKFWASLGADEPPFALGAGHDKEDDWYEDNICLTNRVYSLQDSKLCLIPEYSGKLLKYEILKSTELFVLDFGSEVYVWIGKQADAEKRRKIVKIAFEFWQKGYDYKDCTINPLSSKLEKDDDIDESCSKRPQWTLFGKVNQNMETALFKEKFINWPDASRLIKVKGRSSEGDGKVDLISDLTPYDAKKMVGLNRGPVSTILEGSHVGRGRTWEEMEDGIKKEFEIRTHETDVWYITEFTAQKLDPLSFGQFHCEDTYVVRWKYSIHQIARTLKGQESKQALTGRTRCAYFFWQGRSSSVSEKGASALMTIELDTERGPQMQISQGKEPPCFLNLFSDRMVVHLGKRSSKSANKTSEWKQFFVRNEMPNEIYLLEIPVSAKNLRSRTSFLFINVKTGTTFVWHGAKSISAVREGAKRLANSLEKNFPKELGLAADAKVVTEPEISEGSETKDFWAAVGGRCSRASYGSLLDDPRSFDCNSRLFYMTSVSGVFEAKEIHSTVANDSKVVYAYPYMQEDLYIEEQPALFLLDNHHELFLWQGWWPAETSESDNVCTGSAETRFNVNRKCAMETALHYAKEVSTAKIPKVYLVSAGCEPIEFISLFPFWQPDKRVVLSPSKKSQVTGSLELVSDVLAKLSRKDYTFDELNQRPLPDGVDPMKLENYMGEEEFERVLGMKRKEFSDLQTWKQTEIKQKVGLF